MFCTIFFKIFKSRGVVLGKSFWGSLMLQFIPFFIWSSGQRWGLYYPGPRNFENRKNLKFISFVEKIHGISLVVIKFDHEHKNVLHTFAHHMGFWQHSDENYIFHGYLSPQNKKSWKNAHISAFSGPKPKPFGVWRGLG